MKVRIEATFDVDPGDDTPLDTTHKIVTALGALVDGELLLAFTVDPTESLTESAQRKADESGLDKIETLGSSQPKAEN